MTGLTTTTVKPTKIDTKIIIIAVFAVIALVVAGIAISYYLNHAAQPTNTQISTGSGPGSPAGPSVPVTTTPVPTATQITILPQATPEQIRDSVLISNPTDNTWLGVALRARNVTAALCQQGFKARTDTFRLFPPSLFRAVTVVKYKEGYIYLYPEPNTPAVFLGSSDNPIPKEEELTGAKLYTGTDDFGNYC